MADELEAMKERLRQITLQREAELRVAHENTMEQLAEARTKKKHGKTNCVNSNAWQMRSV